MSRTINEGSFGSRDDYQRNAKRRMAGGHGVRWHKRSGGTADFTYDRNRSEAVRHIVDNAAGSVNTNRSASMTAAMNIAEPVAGRKALFYFAGRIGRRAEPSRVEILRERAANAQVAVYAIDTGGSARWAHQVVWFVWPMTSAHCARSIRQRSI
jgi:hypothetical protein